MASSTTAPKNGASPQNQYFEVVSKVIDEWATSAKKAWESRPDTSIPTLSTLNPAEAVDQVFDFADEALQAQRRLLDFAAELLETQRQLAKNVAETASATKS